MGSSSAWTTMMLCLNKREKTQAGHIPTSLILSSSEEGVGELGVQSAVAV